ncbi:MAG: hypothetical protein AB7I19_01595 [Planctomycetota bacterium]
MRRSDLFVRLLRGALRRRWTWLLLGVVGLLVFWFVLDPILWWIGRSVELLFFVVDRGFGTAIGRHVVLYLSIAVVAWVYRRRWLGEWRRIAMGCRLHRHRRALESLAKGAIPKRRGQVDRRAVSLPAPSWLPLQEALVRLRVDRARAEAEPTPTPSASTPALLRRSIAKLDIERSAPGEDSPVLESRLRSRLEEFPDDVALLGRLSDLLSAGGRVEDALDIESRRVAVAPPADRAWIRARLVELGGRLIRHEIRDGKGGIDRARQRLAKLVAMAAGEESVELLAAELAVAEGDEAEAWRRWIGAWSAEGFLRALDHIDLAAGRLGIEELLGLVPHEVALAILARTAASTGRDALAERAARVLLRRVGPTPAAQSLFDLCRERRDRPDRAPTD